MRILTIHNEYSQSGGEKACVDAQVKLLVSSGHEIILYKRESTEIYNYSTSQKIAFILNTIYSTKTYREIKALISREKPDLAHVHNVFPLISPSVYHALKDSRVPIVQTIHNFRFLCPNGLFFTKGHNCEKCKFGNTFHAVTLKCYRNSYLLSALYALTIGLHRKLNTFKTIDRFIVNTEFMKKKLIESGLADLQKVTVLGNFLMDKPARNIQACHRENYIVYIGRLSEEKGIKTVIETMTRLPQIDLKILGLGPEREALESVVKLHGSENIKFLGYKTGEEKWDIIRHALASVIPSICYDNFPNTLLESMAVGTPVIASNLGSLAFIVQDQKNGLLYNPGDSSDLENKINWLIHNQQKIYEMGFNGQKAIEEEYSGNIQHDRLMQIYKSVCQSGSPLCY